MLRNSVFDVFSNRSFFSQLWIDQKRLVLAFLCYFLVLIVFAFIYFLFDDFVKLSGECDDLTFGRALYFSAVVISTLGFGDITPLSSEARFLVSVESISGVFLVGWFYVEVGRYVSRVSDVRAAKRKWNSLSYKTFTTLSTLFNKLEFHEDKSKEGVRFSSSSCGVYLRPLVFDFSEIDIHSLEIRDYILPGEHRYMWAVDELIKWTKEVEAFVASRNLDDEEIDYDVHMIYSYIGLLDLGSDKSIENNESRTIAIGNIYYHSGSLIRTVLSKFPTAEKVVEGGCGYSYFYSGNTVLGGRVEPVTSIEASREMVKMRGFECFQEIGKQRVD